MKAMILAAGLGTRLRPMTDTIPKALVPIHGTPILELVIARLKSYGFREIIINVHHFADQIIEFLRARNNFDIYIQISDERDLLLDTGGGVKRAAWFFDNQPFVVHNVDILSDIDLNALYEAHLHSQSIATLAVMRRHSTRSLLFDQDFRLCGWQNRRSQEQKIARPSAQNLTPLAFSGIHVIDPAIFNLMPVDSVFSIIDCYLHIAAKYSISAFAHDDTLWFDLGEKDQLIHAADVLRQLQT